MKTNCGVDFEKRLKNRKPYDRWDYIRRSLILSLKNSGKSYKHLEISALRKSMGWKSKTMTAVRNGLVDYELYCDMAKSINESVEVLLSGHEDKYTKPEPTKFVEPKKKQELKLGITITFENRSENTLSLELKGDKIIIHDNWDAPDSAKVVLLPRFTVKSGNRTINKYFPEKVKL